jgi:hypothetical protein
VANPPSEPVQNKLSSGLKTLSDPASALGHLQPASSLSPGRLLPDAFQPFIVGFSEITILNVRSHREQSFK